MAEFEGLVRGFMEAKRRGIPAEEAVLVSAEQEKKAMAEQLKVRVDGVCVVLVAEGEAGSCEVRLTFEEAERFEEALQKATTKVSLRVEALKAREGTKIHGVEEDDEDPGQGVAE